MKKINFAFLAAFLLLVLSACSAQKQGPAPTTSQPSTSTSSTGYSLSDVASHNSASDCWAIIDSQVYDLTAYVESGQHPGGSNVSDCCGIDCSKMFNNIRKHSSATTDSVLEQYLIGPETK